MPDRNSDSAHDSDGDNDKHDDGVDPRVSTVLESDRSGLEQRVYRAVLWYLVDGDRNHATFLTMAAVFVTTVLTGLFGPASVQGFLVGGTDPGTVLLYMITGIITLVTIVLSVNQLVLSYQIGPIEKQRDALQSLLDHRQEVREQVDTAEMAMRPAAFLSTILDGVNDAAEDVRTTVTGGMPETDTATDIEQFTGQLQSDTRAVQATLADTSFGETEMVGAAMHLRAPDQLNQVQTLEHRYRDDLSDTAIDALERLEALLELFITGTSYFKIGTLQSQFIEFSQTLLYAGLPSLVLTFFTILFYGPDAFPGTTLGVPHLLLFTAVALTVATTPFIVLTVYMFRLVTLSRTTIFTGPIHRRPEEDPLSS